MKEIIKAIDGLPMIAKLILAIPALDIVWGIYRILRALDENNTTALIVAIVLLIIPFTWILDIIWVITKNTCFTLDLK